MSVQQINLYLPEFRPRKTWFSALFTAWSCLFVLLALLLVSALIERNVDIYQRNVEIMESQAMSTSERLKDFRSRSPHIDAMDLDSRIVKLRDDILAREKVGTILQMQSYGNVNGFSDILRALAAHSSGDFSLNRIRISANGTLLELSGETRKIASIPLYMQDLQQEDAFRKVNFGVLSMRAREDNSAIHQFSLGFQSLYRSRED